MSSRTEQLTRDIRKTALFRQQVPQEAGVGWPMPFRRQDGPVYVTLLFFSYALDPAAGATKIFPPLAVITVDWERWRAVEYLDLRYRHPWPDDQCEKQVGVFPHPAVAGLSVAEYRKLRSEMLGAYDELLEYLVSGTAFPPNSSPGSVSSSGYSWNPASSPTTGCSAPASSAGSCQARDPADVEGT